MREKKNLIFLLLEKPFNVLIEGSSFLVGSLFVDEFFIHLDTFFLETTETVIQDVEVVVVGHGPDCREIKPKIGVGLIEERQHRNDDISGNFENTSGKGKN